MTIQPIDNRCAKLRWYNKRTGKYKSEELENLVLFTDIVLNFGEKNEQIVTDTDRNGLRRHLQF